MVPAVAAIALAASTGPSAVAQAATVTAKPGGLAAALQAAGPDGHVELATGTYSDQAAVPAHGSDVTVKPAAGATPLLRNVTLHGGSHLRLEGLRIQGIRVLDTDDLTIAGSELTASGAWFEHTDRLTLTGNRMHDAYDGFVVDDAVDLTFTRNECWAVPIASRASHGDCLQTARTTRFAITDNVFRDQPAKPHVDAVEITAANTDGLIARNVFRSVRGVVMAAGSSTPEAMQTRITVVNNLFARTRDFVFVAQRLKDSRIVHNTAPDSGTVTISGASSGNAMVGNIFKTLKLDVSRAKTVLPIEDHNLLTTVPSGYRRGPHDLTGTATFVNPAAGDYHLKAGSKGIGAGTLDWMPVGDLLGAIRETPDLGALEYPG